MDASDNSNRLNAPIKLTDVKLKQTQVVSTAPTFENSEFDALFKLHPTLAVNLRQLNLINHIRFSDRWLADLQPGEPPRLHTMVKKDEVIYVITPEELAFNKRSNSESVALTDSNSSNGNVNLTDATPIYDDIMEIKPGEIPKDQLEKAQTIALQSLVDNLETNDLKSIFKNESETFLKDIDLTQPLDGIINALQEKQRSSYGILIWWQRSCCANSNNRVKMWRVVRSRFYQDH